MPRSSSKTTAAIVQTNPQRPPLAGPRTTVDHLRGDERVELAMISPLSLFTVVSPRIISSNVRPKRNGAIASCCKWLPVELDPDRGEEHRPASVPSNLSLAKSRIST